MTQQTILNLKKAVELNLTKVGFTKIPVAAVRMSTDKSYSMTQLYRDGFVQKTVELFMGIAASFDDNGELEVTFFNDTADEISTVGVNDYKNLSIPKPNGGTEYVPALKLLWGGVPETPSVQKKSGGFFSKLFGTSKDDENSVTPGTPGVPAFIAHITDGDPQDTIEFEKFLAKNENSDTFVQFIVLGNDVSPRIRIIMDKFKNTQMYQIKNPKDLSSDVLYSAIATQKLLAWFE